MPTAGSAVPRGACARQGTASACVRPGTTTTSAAGGVPCRRPQLLCTLRQGPIPLLCQLCSPLAPRLRADILWPPCPRLCPAPSRAMPRHATPCTARIVNVTRNVTVWGRTSVRQAVVQGVQRPVVRYTQLNCNHLLQQLRLLPGVVFTFRSLQLFK